MSKNNKWVSCEKKKPPFNQRLLFWDHKNSVWKSGYLDEISTTEKGEKCYFVNEPELDDSVSLESGYYMIVGSPVENETP